MYPLRRLLIILLRDELITNVMMVRRKDVSFVTKILERITLRLHVINIIFYYIEILFGETFLSQESNCLHGPRAEWKLPSF